MMKRVCILSSFLAASLTLHVGVAFGGFIPGDLLVTANNSGSSSVYQYDSAGAFKQVITGPGLLWGGSAITHDGALAVTYNAGNGATECEQIAQ